MCALEMDCSRDAHPIPLLLVCKGPVTGPTEAESSASQATSLGYSRDARSLMTVVRKRIRSGIRVGLSSVFCITSLIDNLVFYFPGTTRRYNNQALDVRVRQSYNCPEDLAEAELSTDGPCA